MYIYLGETPFRNKTFGIRIHLRHITIFIQTFLKLFNLPVVAVLFTEAVVVTFIIVDGGVADF